MEARRNKDGYMTFLTEEQDRKIDEFMAEFSRRGGMSTKELITRLNAITLDEFMRRLDERIEYYLNLKDRGLL
jgi:hypothetical protein